jgi:hypothetical protein
VGVLESIPGEYLGMTVLCTRLMFFPFFFFFKRHWGLNSGLTLWDTPPALFCDGFFSRYGLENRVRSNSELLPTATPEGWWVGTHHYRVDKQVSVICFLSLWQNNWDKPIPEERFSLAPSFRGLIPWLVSSLLLDMVVGAQGRGGLFTSWKPGSERRATGWGSQMPLQDTSSMT